MRECRECERILPMEEFHKGKNSYCKCCSRKRAKTWYQNNIKRARFNQKKYYMEVLKEMGELGGNYEYDKKCGVYLFKNTITNEFYIGASTNMKQRVSRHFSPRGRTRNKYIYKSVKQYGKEAFVWGVIEYCNTKAEALEREDYYIKKMNPTWNTKKVSK